jgi:prophage DNA circulation protein
MQNWGATIKDIAVMVWDYLRPSLLDLWNTIQTQLWPAIRNLIEILKQFWAFVSPVVIPVLKFLAKIIGVVVVLAVNQLIQRIQGAIQVVAWFANAISAMVNFVRNRIGVIINVFNGVGNFISRALSSAPEAIKRPFREAFDWLKRKAEEAKNFLDKLNPFHRESPSLVDWITKGTGEITKQYDDMFNQLDRKTAEARVGLVSNAEMTTRNTDGLQAGQSMAQRNVNITYNMKGIMAESRSGLREVFKDGIKAVNEDLQARGLATINI